MTLVEVIIVVLILAIISMIVVPRFTSASDEAKDAALMTDIHTTRSQIRLYVTQHAGRLPHLNEFGAMDTANFAKRLTGRTDVAGKLAAGGPMGPYLKVWPENPFSSSSVAAEIKFGTAATPPRDDTTGWYYNTDTGIVSPNSIGGALSMDP